MRTIALLIGIALLAVGIAGFVPGLNQDGLLFGVMPMDAMRSALFAITGAVGIMIGLRRPRDMSGGTMADGDNDMRNRL
jgi:hypothetical protein